MKEVSSMATKGKTETPKTETKAEPVEVRTVKVAEDGTKKYKCQYCGKWIKADTWEEAMAGDYCHQLREKRGFDDASLAEHRASMSADDVPTSKDGREYVKVAVLNKICRREGIPVSRMVKAFGGDRSIDGPMHEKFTPVYVGRARYLHPDCAEEWGLNFMRNIPGGRASNGKTNSKEQEEVENALSE
jgi:hypothetical protein